MQWVLLFLRIFVACCFVFTVFQMNQDRELAPDRNSFDTVGFLLQIRVFVAVVCVFVPTFPRFISGGFPIVPDSFPIVPDLFPTVPDLFRTVPDLFPTKDNLCCFFTDSLDSKQGFFQNHSHPSKEICLADNSISIKSRSNGQDAQLPFTCVIPPGCAPQFELRYK